MDKKLEPVNCKITSLLAGTCFCLTSSLSLAASALPQDSIPVVVEAIQRHADKSYTIIDGKAKNPAQAWRLNFTDNGVEVNSETAQETKPFHLRLLRFGASGKLQEVMPTNPIVQNNTVRYSHGPVEAWYINGPLGLEQGFTLPKTTGPKVVLELTSNWQAAGSGNSVEFTDGVRRWSYSNLQARDAAGNILPAGMRVADGRVRIEVTTRNAIFPVVIDPLLAPKPIKFYSTTKFNRFGNASALSGDGKTLFAGGLYNEVYIFQKSLSGWAYVQTLTKPANLRCNSKVKLFGSALALSANGATALVGASGFVPSGLPGSDNKYFCADLSVYVKNGSTWVLNKLLTSPEITVNDAYGSSVALSADGKTALVGAEFTKCAASTDKCGAAYVFERRTSGWVKRSRFLGAQTYPDKIKGYFGSATALSANGLWGLIGARSGDSAWTFGRISGVWKQLQKLTLPLSYKSYGFGSALGLTGDGARALIGAEDASGADYCKGSWVSYCGAAYSFKRTGSAYALESRMTALDAGGSYFFGEALALSANGLRAVVGANGADCPKGNCGAAYFFVWNGKNWIQQGRYTSPTAGAGGGGKGGSFGKGITASSDGNSVAVSAKTEDCTTGSEDDCGAVYLYSPVYQ